MEYYDPEDVGPRKSPLLAPVRPRLEPDPLNWGSDDETDLEDMIDSDTPWNRALRDRKRPHGRDDDIQPSLRKKNRHAANWRDMILVHEMDPRRGWDVATEAAGDLLPSDDWDDRDYLDDLDNRGKLTAPSLRTLAAEALQAAYMPPDARKTLELESQYSPETSRPPKDLRSRRRRKRFALPQPVAGPPGVFTQVKPEAPTRTPLTKENLQAFLALSETPKKPRSGRRRKRFGLPLLVARPSGTSIEVMACPDSGSDENIISLELATSLGLKTEQTSSDEPRQFTVANGKIVTAVGQVSTSCRFAAGAPSDITKLECIFHVFNTLAVPLIMGVDFLQQTETLSKHRDRLVEQVVPAMQSLRVNSVGRPRRSLVCRLDTYVGCATVDTGSDLDLVNPAFVKARGYKIEPAFEQLEFADCSVGYTSGVVKTSFVVGSVNPLGFRPRGETIDLELFVLDSLNADILVGQDTVDMLDIFNLHNESLIPSMPRLGESDINIIRHIGSLEKGVANLWNKVKRNLGGNSSDGVTGNAEAQVDIDQRENARRERERARIAKLSGADRQRAQELEEIAIQAFESERQRRFLSIRASLASMTPPMGSESLSPAASDIGDSELGIANPQAIQGGYRCTFAGCTALPFQTLYLLNSHANVHSSARPHYCPVKGCPRAEGGKGFKRKNEMIRHGLVHDSPGYVCPFCPDREHKYPRPANLQRHVRVHHVDKDKDDPLLRDVLAQRPDGPNRGRRRRGPTS